jgi:excisionase family DNA binding protein
MPTPSPTAPSTTALRGQPSHTCGIAGGLEGLPLVSTKAQLAAVLQVSTKHVTQLVARRVLRPVRLGRSVRFHRDSVLRALSNLEGAD